MDRMRKLWQRRQRWYYLSESWTSCESSATKFGKRLVPLRMCNAYRTASEATRKKLYRRWQRRWDDFETYSDPEYWEMDPETTKRNELPPIAVAYEIRWLKEIFASFGIGRISRLSQMREKLDDALNVVLGPYNLVRLRLTIQTSQQYLTLQHHHITFH